MAALYRSLSVAQLRLSTAAMSTSSRFRHAQVSPLSDAAAPSKGIRHNPVPACRPRALAAARCTRKWARPALPRRPPAPAHLLPMLAHLTAAPRNSRRGNTSSSSRRRWRSRRGSSRARRRRTHRSRRSRRSHLGTTRSHDRAPCDRGCSNKLHITAAASIVARCGTGG